MVRRVSCVYGDLCINIDTNTGFQFNCDVVIPDSDLLDLASYQRFVKFSEVGSLLCNIILQVIRFICSSLAAVSTVVFWRSFRSLNISSAISS